QALGVGIPDPAVPPQRPTLNAQRPRLAAPPAAGRPSSAGGGPAARAPARTPPAVPPARAGGRSLPAGHRTTAPPTHSAPRPSDRGRPPWPHLHAAARR